MGLYFRAETIYSSIVMMIFEGKGTKKMGRKPSKFGKNLCAEADNLENFT
jgi:hypothetical protein